MTELEKTITLKRKLRLTRKIVDRTYYREQLNRINSAVLEVVGEIEEFIDEISDQGTKEEWNAEVASIIAEEEANSIAVKKQLEEVCSAEVTAVTSERRKEKDADDAREKAKLVQKRKLVREDVSKMLTKMNLLTNLEILDDDKIRRHWNESETWKTDLRNFKERLDDVLIQSAGLGLDEDNATAISSLEKLGDRVREKILKLQEVSDKRGLYLGCENASRDTVEYPTYAGELGENIYEFAAEFKSAVIANQVAEKDKVKKLLKCLSGSARSKMGTYYEDVSEALKELLSYFGNPHVLWTQELESIKKEFRSKSAWGSYGTQGFVLAIASVLEFIRKAKKLASDFPQLKSDIESTYTTNTIRKLLPMKFQDQFNDYLGEEGLNIIEKDKLEKIKKFLEKKKLSAQAQFQVTGGQISDHRNVNRQTSQINSNHEVEDHDLEDNFHESPEHKCSHSDRKTERHNCYEDPVCEVKWHMLGCVQLYHIENIDERMKFLRDHKRCHKCGGFFNQRGLDGSRARQDGVHKCY